MVINFINQMEKVTKENWIRLAMHEDVENRKLALEVAKGMKNDLQEELVCWFASTSNFKQKLEIYELLNDYYKEIVDQVGEVGLPPFEYSDSYIALHVTDDIEGKISILEGYIEGKPFNKLLLLFVKRYKNRKGIGLKAAKDYIDHLRSAVIARKAEMNID